MSSKRKLILQEVPEHARSSETSDVPDEETQGYGFDKGGQPGQVLHFKKFGISYGTDDKAHAAALLLSVGILCVLVFVIIIASAMFVFTEGESPSWIGEVFSFLGAAFTLAVGVAIGTKI